MNLMGWSSPDDVEKVASACFSRRMGFEVTAELFSDGMLVLRIHSEYEHHLEELNQFAVSCHADENLEFWSRVRVDVICASHTTI